MAMIAAAVGAIAFSVQTTNEYSLGQTIAAQHARIALQRIQRAVVEAHGSDEFPAAIVLADREDGYTFPDKLVVWRPEGDPANPEGRPLLGELVMFCPNLAAPSALLEITLPGSTAVAPELSDAAGWSSVVAAFRSGSGNEQVELTDLLRIASVTDDTGDPKRRGCVRFTADMRPSPDQRADFLDGLLDFADLDWPQGICGGNSGLRQTRIAIELQLMPGGGENRVDPNGDVAIPYFGSAVWYGKLTK